MLTNLLTGRSLRRELAAYQASIESATGVTPSHYRPPFGLVNHSVEATTRKLGRRLVAWQVRSFDTTSRAIDDVLRRVLDHVGPGGLVLLHDGGRECHRVLEVTVRILDDLEGHGLTPVRRFVLIACGRDRRPFSCNQCKAGSQSGDAMPEIEKPEIALVTGVGRGFGQAIATALARDGRHVLINYHSRHADSRETASLVETAGASAALVPFDVADEDAASGPIEAILGECGHLDAFVNNAGLIGATRTLAQEVARRGITVYAVAPGSIETEMLGDLDMPEIVNRVALGRPDDVAAVVVLLSGQGASYITVQVLAFNGGIYC